MNKKLGCIMLIDDNPNDNFFHERIIRRSECAENIIVKETAKDALDCIQNREAVPDLIFLDVNMPGMNGWEFLAEYSQFEPALRGRVVVVMLTSSTELDDRVRASSTEGIADFQIKPLTKPKLEEVIRKHFPDHC